MSVVAQLVQMVAPGLRGPGRVPAAQGRAVALRVEPLSEAQRLAPVGRPSLTQHGQAGGAGWIDGSGPFPCPGIAGPVSFTLRVHEARLANGPTCKSLRCASLGAAPVRSPPRSPAMPVAGPLKSGGTEVLAAASPLHSQRSATRPPRQSLAFGSLGGTSAAEPPLLVNLRSAALQPLRQSSWHSGRDAAPPGGRGQPVRQSSHRAPPSCAPVELRGGLVGGSSSGGPGNWLTASAARNPTHPQPLPVREGVMPTPRPPVGGSEEVRARGSVFRATRTGARLISHARR